MGGRNRPDPVHAVVLRQVRGRFRRQRPPRSPAQPSGRAGLDRQLPRRPRLATRQGLGTRQRQFRCDQGVEQERGLRQDHRLFRDAAFTSALAATQRAGHGDRPFAIGYFTIPACIALLRCAAQAPALPLSNASWAAAISFCAAIFPSPSAMFSIIVSVLLRLSQLQPALTRAASAGETAYARAAIAVAASNLLSMITPVLFLDRPRHCRLQKHCSPKRENFRMNFARGCERSAQRPYAESCFFITGP